MKSTGEVMAAAISARPRQALPAPARACRWKDRFISSTTTTSARTSCTWPRALALGFHLVATGGTRVLLKNGVESELVWKVHEARPNIVDRMIKAKWPWPSTPVRKIAFVDDTTSGVLHLQMNVP